MQSIIYMILDKMSKQIERGICPICKKVNSGAVDSHSSESKFLRENYPIDDINEFGECRDGFWIAYKKAKVKMTEDGKQRLLPTI